VIENCPTGFVRIEPGTFTMGSPTSESGRETDESQHSVTITRAFCMQATEVTQGAWLAEMGSNPALFQDCGLDCPVERVSWSDVIYYANELSRREGLASCYVGSTFAGLDCAGYRLPTEAEWEYAARAGTTGPTYGALGSVAWYEGNSGATTHAVGGKLANRFGLYDMLGNVREWSGDWLGAYPVSATDPMGAAAGTYRTFRGGSWFHLADIARAANRLGGTVDYRVDNLGFRLAKTAL
jgi:formylglycine-generating enzyme required for sulfatase activity